MLNRNNLLCNTSSDIKLLFIQYCYLNTDDIIFKIVDDSSDVAGSITFNIDHNTTMRILKDLDKSRPWRFANKYPYFTAGLLFWYPITSYNQIDEIAPRLKAFIKELGDNYFRTAKLNNETEVSFTPSSSMATLLMNFLKTTATFDESILADDNRISLVWDFVQDI